MSRAECAVVVHSKQLDNVGDVAVISDPDGDPSRFGQDVMWFSSTCGDELVADTDRERQIGPSASMEVSQFPAADAKLDAAEPMRLNGHVRPRRDFSNDPLLDALSHGELQPYTASHQL